MAVLSDIHGVLPALDAVPGSVGMPYGRQGAHWALLAPGAVTMRRTGHDPQDALAVMAPRDGCGQADPAT